MAGDLLFFLLPKSNTKSVYSLSFVLLLALLPPLITSPTDPLPGSLLFFFLESSSILSSHQAGFRLGRSPLDQILFLSKSILDKFNKPRLALRRSLLLLISQKLSTLPGTLPSYINLFRLASFLPLLIGLNLSFLIGALAWFIKITKVTPFKSIEVFCNNLFLALYFSIFSLMIFLLLCFLLSAALFILTIWSLDAIPPWSLVQWRPHKEL